jgi:hypothetical protein
MPTTPTIKNNKSEKVLSTNAPDFSKHARHHKKKLLI